MECLQKPILAIFLLGLACAHSQERAAVWQPSPGHVQVPIWPGAVPDAMPNPKPESVGPPAGREWWPRANDVSRPTMTVYAAKGRNTGVGCGGVSRRGLPVPGHGSGGHGDLRLADLARHHLRVAEVPRARLGPDDEGRAHATTQRCKRRCRMRSARSGWCASTPRSGRSTRTRSA